MKIKRPKNKYMKIVVPVAVLLAVAASSLVYVYALNGSILGWNNDNNATDSSTNLEEPTDEQKEAGDRAKQDTADSTKPESNNSDGGSQATAPQPGNSKSTVDVSFTAKSRTQVRLLISTVDNSGSCTLTLTQGSQTVTKTSGTQAQSSSTTCEGFDFQLSPGPWQAVVKYEGVQTTGSATTTIPAE